MGKVRGGRAGCKGENQQATRRLSLTLDHCQTEDIRSEESTRARTHEGGGGREGDVTPCHPAVPTQRGPPPLRSASLVVPCLRGGKSARGRFSLGETHAFKSEPVK